MKAHHTRVKFLFNLLFENKTLEEMESVYKYKDKTIFNEWRRGWRKEINCGQSQRKERKRRSSMLFIPLNLKFNGAAAHHIDKEHVIYIPKELHSKYWHSLEIPESMALINRVSFRFLVGLK